MSLGRWLLVAAAAILALWLLLVAALLMAGRRSQARALAGFVPDCVVLFGRLARDPALARRHRWALLAVLAYLALPFDLVPDFIPVAGQLDDAILVALALRTILRSGGPDAVRRHWPGPPESLRVMLRLVGDQRTKRIVSG